ncbi:hypothetical protein AOG28_13175 [Cobetia sp. UCD-24C]|nr:hypothetical protein AOG28_13175 [Cobetia sp. UCD-24C]
MMISLGYTSCYSKAQHTQGVAHRHSPFRTPSLPCPPDPPPDPRRTRHRQDSDVTLSAWMGVPEDGLRAAAIRRATTPGT